MLLPPSFRREQLNPSLAEKAEIGDLFQQFALDLFRSDHPDLYSFAGIGRDGAIDLAEDSGDVRLVIECKFIGEDGFESARARWRKTAANLTKHVAETSEPKAGQKYAPWFRADRPIQRYLFVTSSIIGAQADVDKLRDEIQDFFQDLSQKPHLGHLGRLRVEVNDWNAIQPQLQRNPSVLFDWFPSSLVGFSLLEDSHLLAGFRGYLTAAKLPYLSRQKYAAELGELSILSEEGMIAALESSQSGIIITGEGGSGKTRLTLELGRLAKLSGWLVLRARTRLRSSDLDSIVKYSAKQPTLIVIDYVETQPEFSDFVEHLNELNDEVGCQLRYVANCRNSYYVTIAQTLRHMRVDLSPVERKAAWEQAYRKRVVRHILESGRIDDGPEAARVCGDTPILAVFMSFLRAQDREEDLRALIHEASFDEWLYKRIQLSFPGVPPAILIHDLSVLMALFPFSQSSYQHILRNNYGPLLRNLQQDGWLEKGSAVGHEDISWAVLHDVFADRLLLKYVSLTHADPSSFCAECLEKAREYGCLRSAVIALQRVGSNPEFTDVPWLHLFRSAILEHPDSWKAVRDLLLKNSLITFRDSIDLLGVNSEFWAGAEMMTEIQDNLAYLAKALTSQPASEVERNSETFLRRCYFALALILRRLTMRSRVPLNFLHRKLAHWLKHGSLADHVSLPRSSL